MESFSSSSSRVHFRSTGRSPAWGLARKVTGKHLTVRDMVLHPGHPLKTTKLFFMMKKHKNCQGLHSWELSTIPSATLLGVLERISPHFFSQWDSLQWYLPRKREPHCIPSSCSTTQRAAGSSLHQAGSGPWDQEAQKNFIGNQFMMSDPVPHQECNPLGRAPQTIAKAFKLPPNLYAHSRYITGRTKLSKFFGASLLFYWDDFCNVLLVSPTLQILEGARGR